MPEVSVGVQLSVELTRIFGAKLVHKAAQSAYDAILSIARDLRKSGSDLLVEADLTDVFGRGVIEQYLEQQFRSTVLQESKIVPIQNGSVLALSTGPGPTLTRAAPPSEQQLMASVIQLSFLAWAHGRKSLASTLSECLDKRFEMGVGKTPSPGFDGLVGVLEACSSQTSDFDWSKYYESVKTRLETTFGHNYAEDEESAILLPPSLLLACIDCLYIIQRTPEERIMTVSGPRGMLTLIVWAHHLLGIEVLVKGVRSPSEVLFSNGSHASPGTIIVFRDISYKDPTVCLLDKETKVVLTIQPQNQDVADIMPMEPRERLKLRGYGTISLCRVLNESLDIIRDQENPALVDAAELTIAMARLASKRLYRAVDATYTGARTFSGAPENRLTIERWRVYDAAMILFAHPFSSDWGERVKYREDRAELFLERLGAIRTWDEAQLPAALAVPKYRSIVSRRFATLAATLLCLATVIGINDCGDMKLVYGGCMTEHGSFGSKFYDMRADLPINPHDLFEHVSRLLVGSDDLRFEYRGDTDNSGESSCFMISDFGWTVGLPTFGDSDPFSVLPESIYIRKGTPTNMKTMERKGRVIDAIPGTIEVIGNEMPSNRTWVCDRSKDTYLARCISPVHERIEYYGSRNDGFHLAIKFKGNHIEHIDANGELYWFEVTQSCRSFHEALWRTYTAPPCPHRESFGLAESSETLKLGLSVATAAGVWAWSRREWSRHKVVEPERIIIVLVKGDARARWLAIGDIMKKGPTEAIGNPQSRKTMLKGKHSCENCAVEAAASRSGEWFVVI